MEATAPGRWSAAEQDEVWARWQKGASFRAIGRRFGTHLHAVRRFVARTGGCRRPPPRRAEGALTAAEREEVSRGLAAGASYRAIAAQLGRAHATVSREVARNGGPAHYRAAAADTAAWRRAERPKPALLATRPALREAVEAKLRPRWSPEQIAAWLRRAYPDDASMRVSHETTYRSLVVQPRGALRRELTRYLRTGRALRFPRGARTGGGRGQLRDTVAIRARSARGPPRPRTARCRATGRATWCSAAARAPSARSSSAARATWRSSRCRPATRRRRCARRSRPPSRGCPSNCAAR